jgi:hypothetical protein
MKREARQGPDSIRLPPPFAAPDATVLRRSTTAQPTQPNGWMLRQPSSKITTWGMQSQACEGLPGGI